MLVYNYHPETKIYWGSEEAFPDPLEEGKFLIPAFSTTIAPPELREGEYAVFDNDSWRVYSLNVDFTGNLEDIRSDFNAFVPAVMQQLEQMQSELAKLQKKLKKIKKK